MFGPHIKIDAANHPTLKNSKGPTAMAQWSNTAPDVATKYAYELHRTPADRPLNAIITSNDIIGCHTHYWGGRTVPCEAPHCPACDEGMPSRWHAYLSVFDPKTHDHFLFECTAKAVQPLEEYRDSYGTLRGCFFSASRPKRRKNSKIIIAVRPADLTKTRIPDALDVIRAMSIIWQMPDTALQTPSAEHSTPTITPDHAIINRMRDVSPNNNGRKKPCTSPDPA